MRCSPQMCGSYVGLSFFLCALPPVKDIAVSIVGFIGVIKFFPFTSERSASLRAISLAIANLVVQQRVHIHSQDGSLSFTLPFSAVGWDLFQVHSVRSA